MGQIRVWKLGSLDHRLFPTQAAIQKLADILKSHPVGESFDLIWGPDLNTFTINDISEIPSEFGKVEVERERDVETMDVIVYNVLPKENDDK